MLFWWTGIWTTLLILLFRYQMTPLYLWVVPASFLYFLVLWQTWPYCLDGWPVCFPHGGPCIFWAALGTTLLWTGFFILRYGCFLFPCVCAPEVPGWFFFPPSNMLLSPLEGEIQPRYSRDTAQIQPRYSPDTAQIQPRYSPDVAEVSSEIQPRYSPDTAQMLPLEGGGHGWLWALIDQCLYDRMRVAPRRVGH